MEMRASPLIVPGEVPPPTPPLSTSTIGPCRDETFYFDMTVFEVRPPILYNSSTLQLNH